MYKEPGAYTNIEKKDLEEEVRYVVAIDNTAPTTSKNKVWSINKIDAEFAKQNEVKKVSSDLENIKTSKVDELFVNQEDFVESLKRLYKPIKMSIIPNNVETNNYSIIYTLPNNKGIQYGIFEKTLNSVVDEYLLFGEGKYGNIETLQTKRKMEHYDATTGTWNTQYPPSYYATEVGATMTKSFYGSRFDFYSFGDNRGGIWEFVVDGDTANKITHSTWRENAGAISPVTIFTSDANEQHTIVATFKGDDPQHAPSSGAGTSRGWTYYNENGNAVNSFYIYDCSQNVSNIIQPLFSTSNKEFAIEARKAGTSNPYHFCPYHSAITSKKIEPPKLLINGAEYNFKNSTIVDNVEEFKIVQRIYHKNPETVENLAEITTITVFKKDGTVTIDGKYKALVDLDINAGYGTMITLNTQFNKKMIDSIRKEYETTPEKIGTNLYLSTEIDKTISFISLNDKYKNLALACTFNNPKESLRQGMGGKTALDKCTWINYRNNDLTKIYQQIYSKTKIKANEVFRFSGTFILAECNNLYDLF